jgi:ATP-dependent RNA helicase DDX5/DBP2
MEDLFDFSVPLESALTVKKKPSENAKTKVTHHTLLLCVSRNSSHAPALSLQTAKAIAAHAQAQGPTAKPMSKALAAFCAEHEVVISDPTACPDPYTSFKQLVLPDTIQSQIDKALYTAPTAIQAISWPIAFQGHDIVAIAKTGSGKTLAYLIPCFLAIAKAPVTKPKKDDGPLALVLVPTRELALQVHQEATNFGRSTGIRACAAFGGVPRAVQLPIIQHRLGVQLLAATPGRLNDFLISGQITLRRVVMAVLDEADRMLDMGFMPQVQRIVDSMPPAAQRRTMFFTATWPAAVRDLAAHLLRDPVTVRIGGGGGCAADGTAEVSANKDVVQRVLVVPKEEKHAELLRLLRALPRPGKALVFVAKKLVANDLAQDLKAEESAGNFLVDTLHGDRTQKERNLTMKVCWYAPWTLGEAQLATLVVVVCSCASV